MNVMMGKQELELGGKYLGDLRDSTEIMAEPAALQERMEKEGYLLLRGLHDPARVRAVRDLILANLAENDQIDPSLPREQGAVRAGARGSFLGGSKALTRNQTFLDLVESPRLMDFFAHFLRSDVLTFDYKWLRVVAPGDFTGAHYDVVYMGRGTHNLYTCWTPITNVTYDMGPLALLTGTNRGTELERVKSTYGRMDVDRDHVTGAFSNDPIEMVEKLGGRWQTAEFEMGDAVIFGMFTMHGSLTNTSSRYRISCDTRYQRADEPVDERWIGENPPAHYAWQKGETVTMEEARRKWEV